MAIIPPSTPSNGNNFDLIRLLLAVSVVFHHVYGLSELPVFEPLYIRTLYSVQGFFIISGYLIVMSYENSRSLYSYAIKRIRRIYPAYLFVILFWFTAGAAITTLSIGQYFSYASLKYLVSNLFFMEFLEKSLPGVFSGNPKDAVNGVIWTLKIEVMFYALVPLLVLWLNKTNKLALLVAIYCLSFVYCAYFASLDQGNGNRIHEQFSKQLPGQMMFFSIGMIFYYYQEYLKFWIKILALPALIFLLSVPILTPFEAFLNAALLQAIIQPVALGILVIGAALVLPYLGNFGKYGDFSYGIYIWHFPLIQFFVYLGIFNTHPWSGLALLLTSVAIMAAISWNFVEKPFIGRKSHYFQYAGN